MIWALSWNKKIPVFLRFKGRQAGGWTPSFRYLVISPFSSKWSFLWDWPVLWMRLSLTRGPLPRPTPLEIQCFLQTLHLINVKVPPHDNEIEYSAWSRAFHAIEWVIYCISLLSVIRTTSKPLIMLVLTTVNISLSWRRPLCQCLAKIGIGSLCGVTGFALAQAEACLW